jgi:hypothetical protein
MSHNESVQLLAKNGFDVDVGVVETGLTFTHP